MPREIERGFEFDDEDRIVILDEPIAPGGPNRAIITLKGRPRRYFLIVSPTNNPAATREYELGDKIPPDTGINLRGKVVTAGTKSAKKASAKTQRKK